MATRLISVTYGHEGSGQLYDYETDKQYRAGDIVVEPVTHWKSGKTYNTLARVELSSKIDSVKGQQKSKALEKSDIAVKNTSLRLRVAQNAGLDVKTDRQVNITTLAGYSTRANDENWSGVSRSQRAAARLISRAA